MIQRPPGASGVQDRKRRLKGYRSVAALRRTVGRSKANKHCQCFHSGLRGKAAPSYKVGPDKMKLGWFRSVSDNGAGKQRVWCFGVLKRAAVARKRDQLVKAALMISD